MAWQRWQAISHERGAGAAGISAALPISTTRRSTSCAVSSAPRPSLATAAKDGQPRTFISGASCSRLSAGGASCLLYCITTGRSSGRPWWRRLPSISFIDSMFSSSASRRLSATNTTPSAPASS
jgi:hypothetical protein